MRDVLPAIDRWRSEGKQVASATVVAVWGSAPRPVGSRMAISSAGEMAGSVSGGCVEGAVFEEAQHVIASGLPKLLGFGVSDEQAWSVGLSCGGTIEVFLERLPLATAPAEATVYDEVRHALAAERSFALATIVRGPGLGRQIVMDADGTRAGGLGPASLERLARERALALLRTFRSEKLALAIDGTEFDVFVECHGPKPRLLVVGAVHVAVPLVHFARILGFTTVVVDPRSAFASRERFPHADDLMAEWPEDAFPRVGLNEATSLVVLSHDLKIDVPALALALRSPSPYIGALGSRKTQRKRAAALEAEGFTAADLTRIHSPIGLDLGGRRAEEIALAIIAEVVAVGHGIGARGEQVASDQL